MKAWSHVETMRFLAHIDDTDDPQAELWRFLLHTGCRRGEALGVEWGDVDHDDHTITTRRSWTELDGRPAMSTPKNGRGRVVAIDDTTVAMLGRMRLAKNERRLMAGAGWRDLDVVFDNGRGGRIDPQWPTNRLRALVKQPGCSGSACTDFVTQAPPPRSTRASMCGSCPSGSAIRASGSRGTPTAMSSTITVVTPRTSSARTSPGRPPDARSLDRAVAF